MINEHVRSIGVEIECGIALCYLRYLRSKYNIKYSSDASVYVPNEEYNNYSANDLPKHDDGAWVYNAELKYHTSNYNHLRQFIKEAFDSSYLWQNSSCGNHIHIHFAKNYYVTHLFSYNCIRQFINMYVEFAKTQLDTEKYMCRLGNSYSKEIKSIEDILSNYICDRYFMMNIQCNKKHRKSSFIEYRIFPYAEDAEEYLKIVDFLLSAINKLLQGMPNRHIYKI